ncbi:replication initiation factor family protein [Aneurinibacillus thermoaerophilus]|uniref:replication initiation factor family protein n=1 Tax=Aneurinibacillus thermoaerophilus TaxID=143495 RepID=UPI002E21CDCE|nr:replication initiation factor family protein [Aneurinibacillus thermoaerophilus]MED0766279.1 replication initiation factor family protein [Aneurinibacillus thermoaerophilus]
MSSIKLSIDRIVIEYRDVYWTFFNPFKQNICDYYGIKEYIGKTGFKYHLHIREYPDRYFHISYQPYHEPKSMKHTLRIETHPDHLEYFQHILDGLKANASTIWFVRCDVAFDIPCPMNQVFTASRTGRYMNLYEGTRYYGKKSQRQQAGYCRVYDKCKEQKERKQKKTVGALTRVEIVYKPQEKIPMDSLIQFPPTFNNLYSCSILTDLEPLKPEKRAMVLAVQQGLMTLDDFTPYHRRTIQKLLESQEMIDFDQIAHEQWEENVIVPCALLCGTVNRVKAG